MFRKLSIHAYTRRHQRPVRILRRLLFVETRLRNLPVTIVDSRLLPLGWKAYVWVPGVCCGSLARARWTRRTGPVGEGTGFLWKGNWR